VSVPDNGRPVFMHPLLRTIWREGDDSCGSLPDEILDNNRFIDSIRQRMMGADSDVRIYYDYQKDVRAHIPSEIVALQSIGNDRLGLIIRKRIAGARPMNEWCYSVVDTTGELLYQYLFWRGKAADAPAFCAYSGDRKKIYGIFGPAGTHRYWRKCALPASGEGGGKKK
jgi:hypothetical protein